MLGNIIKLLRPNQWIKNLFVLAPLIFSLQFYDYESIKSALLATFSFIAISSALYVFNDIIDIEEDKKHKTKKLRPLAAGKVSLETAIAVAMLLTILAFVFSINLDESCLFILVSYAIIGVLYSMLLKKITVIDVITIATGFVLRVIMGGSAISVAISPWIIIATFTLALFIGFSKRFSESKENPSKLYSLELLDKYINISCATTLLTYFMYTVEASEKMGKNAIIYTSVFVVFGMFYYLRIIYSDKKPMLPEEIIYKKPLFTANIIAWLITTIWLLH